MDDKKIIMRLLQEPPCEGSDEPGACPHRHYELCYAANNLSYCTLSHIADNLIAHGVTVPKHGRWVLIGADKRGRGGVWKCTACNKCYPYKTSGYCPNCGAKMDGEADA